MTQASYIDLYILSPDILYSNQGQENLRRCWHLFVPTESGRNLSASGVSPDQQPINFYAPNNWKQYSILSGFSLYYQCFCSKFFYQTREKSSHHPGQSGLSRKHNGWFIFFNCAKYFFCHLFNRIGGSRQNRQISSSILNLIPLLFILKWIS